MYGWLIDLLFHITQLVNRNFMMSHRAIGKLFSLEWLEINEPNRYVELQRQLFRNFKTGLWWKPIDGFGTFVWKHTISSKLCVDWLGQACARLSRRHASIWFKHLQAFSKIFLCKEKVYIWRLTVDCWFVRKKSSLSFIATLNFVIDDPSISKPTSHWPVFFFRVNGMLWSYLAYINIRFSILLHLEVAHWNRFWAKVW